MLMTKVSHRHTRQDDNLNTFILKSIVIKGVAKLKLIFYKLIFHVNYPK